MKTNTPVGARAGGYGLLALLTLTNTLNFVDRNLLGSFANFLKPELHLTDFQFGLLTGLVFLVFYSVAGLFMGILADLTHRPRLIAVAIGLWSLLTAASGAARGFVSLALPRAMIGVGESALTPSAMSLLADSVDRARMGLAAGIYYMGVPLGTGAGLLVAGYLGPAIGWRNCFYVLGAIGLAVASIYLFVPEPRPARPPTRVKGPGLGEQVRLLVDALRRSPALAATMIGGTALHFAVGAAQFDQLWFVTERGFERGEIARLSGYVTVVAGVSGNLFGGFIGDWWHRHRKSGRPMVLAAMMLVVLPLAVGYRLMPPGSPLFVAGMGLGVFQLAAFYGPTFSTVQELAPPGARATVTAFYLLCLNVIGLGISITGAGWAIDHFRAAGADQSYTYSALIFIGASALAIPSFFAAGAWAKRDRERIDVAASA
ncbi:MAG: MFS transporter [Phenylobacterium sp.]|uniref:spinster family MFS transporter n=1 Tax=Phenylobacterium sp. TaxID=1871053 RepID=UPI0025D01BA1|nr:MFS transporter [Phenylobacterium sp.]MBI1199935.1 MFS transporter [Phenylobacterium sp.]